MKNYYETLEFLKQWQSDICPVCGKHFELHAEKKIDLHHQAHNDAHAKMWYPLFVDSVLNLYAINHECHVGNGEDSGNKFHLGDLEAAVFERYLNMAKAVKTSPQDETLQDNFDLSYMEAENILVQKLTNEIWHKLTKAGIEIKTMELLDKAKEAI